MKKLLLSLFLVISPLWLTGCFSPVKIPPQNTYVINQVPAVAYKERTRPVTLLVLPTETNPVYDTTNMAYTTKPYQVAYFANNVWAETPGKMMTPLIVQALQNTHHFHAVVTAPFAGRYHYVLTTQIQQLEQDFSFQPSVLRFRLYAQLIRSSDNRLIAAKQFSVVEMIPTNNPYGGVIAANEAAGDILQQLSIFCLRLR